MCSTSEKRSNIRCAFGNVNKFVVYIYMIKRRVAIIFEGITICGISNLRYVIHVDQLGLIKQVKCMNILKNGRKL